MTDRGEVGTVKEVAPNLGVKVLLVTTPVAFVGGTDTIAVDLGDYGASKVYAVSGSYQSTTGEILADAAIAVDSNTSGVIVISTSAAGTGVYGIVIYAY